MVEHVSVSGERVNVPRTLQPNENVSLAGSQARRGEVLLDPGVRLDFARIALLASVGRPRVSVFVRPQVALLATGDEIVQVNETPLDCQVRNSNVESLAVQVARAGGCPHILPVARDLYDATRELVERGLQSDLLLLSGGVSAGKYDIVERVLADLGAEFFFDRVLIMPGQPLVFGRAQGKFFFGLPGNPASTLVTFEIFARAAVELLGGQERTHAAAGLDATRARSQTENRPDAIPPSPPQRGRLLSQPASVARFRRRARPGARQCVRSHRSRSRKLAGRRLDSRSDEIAAHEEKA